MKLYKKMNISFAVISAFALFFFIMNFFPEEGKELFPYITTTSMDFGYVALLFLALVIASIHGGNRLTGYNLVLYKSYQRKTVYFQKNIQFVIPIVLAIIASIIYLSCGASFYYVVKQFALLIPYLSLIIYSNFTNGKKIHSTIIIIFMALYTFIQFSSLQWQDNNYLIYFWVYFGLTMMAICTYIASLFYGYRLKVKKYLY